ncbi:MAG: LysR substrate-binding domain-containing protein [Brevibacterium sp.]|uniref:LysR family transcriptional regulator n=2 Tax=Brevibacterium aurantiacum TaxID=273384 RepID=A0A2A3X535_BREAU|nr:MULTISPECIES: LysR substrate-binding domain-containing protein [Brevibacterium]AZL11741.1 LysR family transcriptional regulator [Brevibacterium aurantiacum]AZT95979.1 LysR family transcriptional regulator [Brevibacterium aurantiacum]MDN5594213.1 LysR substrate-binding domain-containing protein [Brevibacterium sp.]MDN5608260.1 LysR substrate-binding domain-containing protein [Brevibacterium sp.]MDN5834712.1 LysR substrate-binding domain-containing protein [Brevibacterium sp.]
MMEIQQVRAFLAVAEELHFGRAAERLGVLQPPLSRTIRALEDDLGVTLFQRTTRNVKLSSAGEALVEPARKMIEFQSLAVDSVQRAATGETGRISFGFARSSSRTLAASLVTVSRRQNPGIVFSLESNVFAEEGLARLVDGTLDLALVRWDKQPPEVTGRPVMAERLCAALPEGHRLAAHSSLRVEDLADEDFITLPEHPSSTLRENTMRLCRDAGFSPRLVQAAPDSQTIGALVAAGLGISITFDSVSANTREAGTVAVPLDVEQAPSTLYLAHRTDHGKPSLEAVLALAEEVLPTVG